MITTSFADRNEKIKTITMMGSTQNIDSNSDRNNVVNHSSDFCLPHSMLYSKMKNAGATVPATTNSQGIIMHL